MRARIKRPVPKRLPNMLEPHRHGCRAAKMTVEQRLTHHRVSQRNSGRSNTDQDHAADRPDVPRALDADHSDDNAARNSIQADRRPPVRIDERHCSDAQCASSQPRFRSATRRLPGGSSVLRRIARIGVFAARISGTGTLFSAKSEPKSMFLGTLID